MDATQNVFPDWLEVAFAGSKTVDEISVFGLQDTYASPQEPTEAMTGAAYGLSAFDVQYWTGSAWATVPGGSVTGNTKVWRKLTFPSITTTKIRVMCQGGSSGYSRVVEVEAWGAGADPRWLVTDRLGTSRMVLDATGQLAGVSRHDYLPFGEEVASGVSGRTAGRGYAQPDDVRQQFTGYERDDEMALDYARARYYSSAQGRFTGVDPFNVIMQAQVKAESAAGQAREQLQHYLGQPQRWNRYAYVTNNPLKFVDPTGEDLELTGDTDAERQTAFKRIKDVVDPSARNQLYVKKVRVGGKDRYLVKYKGGFASKGPLEAGIAALINDKRTTEFKVAETYRDKFGREHSVAANGGGATVSAWATSTGNLQVFVHPPAGRVGTESIARGGRPVSDDGMAYIQTDENVDAHELGHAFAEQAICYDPRVPHSERVFSRDKSLEFENYTRRRAPPRNQRIRH